ncbi:hypothetical protein MRBLPD1_000152 [Pseudomonas brassicacearum]|uniref:DUF6896 domain-containing protein n=1 Tax=Pseudomonas brassicacearum TaxID=930166 RepID=UPI0034671700
MNNQLINLISDYQSSVRTAVELMQQSGIPLPLSCTDWLETDIPQQGELEGGIRYFKHGYGCAVSLPTGKVDFDFGEQGEIGGFDIWRLAGFAGTRLTEYGFDTEDALKGSFQAAVKAGSLVYSGYILYYIAGVARTLAIEALNIQPNDSLPSPDQDPVLTLYAHYFLAADLMHDNYVKLDNKWKKYSYLNQNDKSKLGIYLSSWLGFLGVTCEGFRKLRLRLLLQENRPKEFHELISKCDEIGNMMKRHSDPLREFRNNVFHLRDDVEAINRFFSCGTDRLPWAGELHAAIAELLSQYRILCDVHYLMHDRKSESQLGRIPLKCRRTNAS